VWVAGRVLVTVLFAGDASWAIDTLGMWPSNRMRNSAVAGCSKMRQQLQQSADHLALVALLDVDFVPSLNEADTLRLLLRTGAAAEFLRRRDAARSTGAKKKPFGLVLAALEDIEDATAVASNDTSLSFDVTERLLWSGARVGVHSRRYRDAHGRTEEYRWARNSRQWLAEAHATLAVDEAPWPVLARLPLSPSLYEVVPTREYEPYLLFDEQDYIPFDERLVGYGFDKVQGVQALVLGGGPGGQAAMDLAVLPLLSLHHQPHPPSPWARKAAVFRPRVFRTYFRLREAALLAAVGDDTYQQWRLAPCHEQPA